MLFWFSLLKVTVYFRDGSNLRRLKLQEPDDLKGSLMCFDAARRDILARLGQSLDRRFAESEIGGGVKVLRTAQIFNLDTWPHDSKEISGEQIC